MFGTVVDCFITVDRLVFLEKRLTMQELLQAVDANFEGYEEILALCRKVEKYGSDTPHSNAHVSRLSRLASNLIMEKNRPYLRDYGIFLVPCLQSDTWHLKYGEKYTATPNGRLAYTPYSQNSRPSNGACINGLSAMLNSMLNLPAGGYLSGALNLDIDPKQFAGESGRAMLASILAVYFNKGGLHAQVSAANVEDLIDAKEHPDRHRDLRVRVTGYSGIFVDICDRLQNDIIDRFR
jgi:formate C-acetyltransferase